MTDTDNAALVVARLATERTAPSQLTPGTIYSYMTHGGPQVVDLTGDQYLPWPARKRGTVYADDVASFARYYGKHADGSSEVFADIGAWSITAVLDAHNSDGSYQHGSELDGARWQEHRLVLKLAVTPEWATWTGANGKMSPQVTFAEFIEDHITDIAADGPCTGADLLEMAQQFQAHTKVQFSSGSRLSSGETQFTYAETIEAKAGQRGNITIPGAFELAIRVFEDLDPYRVKARFRYRLNDGALLLGYRLNDPERIVRDAVDLVIAKAEEATGVTIMRGRPS